MLVAKDGQELRIKMCLNEKPCCLQASLALSWLPTSLNMGSLGYKKPRCHKGDVNIFLFLPVGGTTAVSCSWWLVPCPAHCLLSLWPVN